mmetsp:Transcript_34147/g.74979  ORF Transcript_34147/g.74979 Transcript_34147/m.74979 type:complete len:230 (-) Transcript_34147:1816-2505(-)
MARRGALGRVPAPAARAHAASRPAAQRRLLHGPRKVVRRHRHRRHPRKHPPPRLRLLHNHTIPRPLLPLQQAHRPVHLLFLLRGHPEDFCVWRLLLPRRVVPLRFRHRARVLARADGKRRRRGHQADRAANPADAAPSLACRAHPAPHPAAQGHEPVDLSRPQPPLHHRPVHPGSPQRLRPPLHRHLHIRRLGRRALHVRQTHRRRVQRRAKLRHLRLRLLVALPVAHG